MTIGIENDDELTDAGDAASGTGSAMNDAGSGNDDSLGDHSASGGDTNGDRAPAHEPEDEGPLGRTEPPPSEPPAPEAAAAPDGAAEKPAAAAAEADDAELDEARAKLPWYVVQTYSGFEMRVKMSLEERIRSLNLTPRFGRIIVPQEAVEEMTKGGQKKTSMKKVFPGYIVVQMALDDETWHLVKDTPKVTGFVGDSRNPSPLSPQEVQTLLLQMEGGAKRPRPKKQFEEGDAVKVVDGPFADFNGTVDEVKPDKGKLRVLISIFGRNTPVELDFAQVEKV